MQRTGNRPLRSAPALRAPPFENHCLKDITKAIVVSREGLPDLLKQLSRNDINIIK